MSKNTLTIKKYWNSGGDLETEVASFMVRDSSTVTVFCNWL